MAATSPSALPRRDVVAMCALVGIGAMVTVFVGERLGVNGGEGWDGQAYAAWARDFPSVLTNGVTQYQSQRVLPSALIYYASELLGIAHTRANVIAGFQLLGVAALLVTAVVLARIAIRQGWSRPVAWTAFAATFLSFANARHALYAPVLTDSIGFALGAIAVWAFLERRHGVQWVVASCSAFTWPALMFVSCVALVLPRPRTRTALPDDGGPVHRRALALALAIAAAGLIVAWLVEEILRPFPGTETRLAISHQALWPLTIAIIALYTGAAAYLVTREPRTWALRAYLRQLGWKHLVVACAAVAVIAVLRTLWVGHVGRDVGLNLNALQHLFASYAVRAPLWSIVHHVVYFGPIVLVAIGFWGDIARQAAQWGPTAVIALGVVVLTAVSSESRHLNHLMPLVVVLVFTATAEHWTVGRALVFAVLSLAWSKVWMRIGYVEARDPFAWPDLRYTMHHGPWATDATFIAHLIAALVTSVVLAIAFRRSRLDRDGPRAPSPAP